MVLSVLLLSFTSIISCSIIFNYRSSWYHDCYFGVFHGTINPMTSFSKQALLADPVLGITSGSRIWEFRVWVWGGGVHIHGGSLEENLDAYRWLARNEGIDP